MKISLAASRFILRLFIFCGIASIAFICFAEEIELEQITIKKNPKEDLAVGQDYLFAEDIEALPYFSLEEIIDYSPSVDLRKRSVFGIQQDVSLRGSIFEDTVIELQGVKINDPQTGHFNLELPLTSADLEQIEISKNSQKINFILQKPKSKGMLLSASFGQHALWEELLSFNFPLKEAKNRISVEHKQSKGARPDTDFEIYNLSLHSLWEAENKDKEVEFLFGCTKRDFGANSFYTSAFPHQEEHTRLRFFSLRSGLKKEPYSLSNTFYLRRHWDKFILDRHHPGFFTNIHTTYVYGLKSELDFLQELFLSFDIDRETIDSTNLNQHRRLRKSLSLGVKEKKVGNLQFSFHGGFDHYNKWEYLENIHFALGYPLRDDLELGFSFDRFWRIPSFTELFYSSPSNRGNSNLDAQRSNTFEWGIDYHPDEQFLAALNFFFRDQSDTIDWVRNASAFAWEARNVEDLGVWGLDFYTQFNFQNDILNKLSLGYTYLDLDQDNPFRFSKYVFDYNRHKVISILGLNIEGLTLNLITNFSRPVKRKRYTTFDLKITKEFPSFSLVLEGLNIFDSDFQELQDIDGPGRLIRTSIVFSF